MALTDDIETAASKPKRGKEDGLEIEERSIDEMIKADKYMKSKSALNKGTFGFKLFQMLPPGTQGN